MLDRFFRTVVYARLHPDSLSVRDVSSGREVKGPPVVAVSRNPEKVLAVGAAAMTAGAPEIINPFKHPRTLVSDFTAAQVVFKGFFKQLFEGRLFATSPIVVLHPKVDPEGGFTQIEIRALQELAIGAGASRVIVWQGRDLAENELRELKFGAGGRDISS